MTTVIVVSGIVVFLFLALVLAAIGALFAYLFRQLRQQRQDIQQLDETLTDICELMVSQRHRSAPSPNGQRTSSQAFR